MTDITFNASKHTAIESFISTVGRASTVFNEDASNFVCEDNAHLLDNRAWTKDDLLKLAKAYKQSIADSGLADSLVDNGIMSKASRQTMINLAANAVVGIAVKGKSAKTLDASAKAGKAELAARGHKGSNRAGTARKAAMKSDDIRKAVAELFELHAALGNKPKAADLKGFADAFAKKLAPLAPSTK